MTEEAQAEGSRYQDRSFVLQFFGVLLLLGGGLVGLLACLYAGIYAMASAGGSGSLGGQELGNPALILPAAFVYGLLAIVLLTLGFGSCLLRRWARAIIHAGSWSSLVIGVVALVGMAVVLPATLDQMPQLMEEQAAATGQETPPLPDDFGAIFMVFMLAFAFVVYVVIPGTFLLVYRSPHARATVEYRDPKPRWTDDVPLLVLTLVLWLGLMAIMAPMTALYPAMPAFGFTLRGTPLVATALFGSVLLAFLTVQARHRRPVAWWGTLVLTVLGGASTVWMVQSNELGNVYREWGLPESSVQMAEDLLEAPSTMVFMLAVWVPWLVYVALLRKYFRPAAA